MKETLYNKIYSDLLAKIQGGIYAPGDRLPTEEELMSLYGVSRITAARAMRELEQGFYITRKPKRGSFVRDYLAAESRTGTGARIAVVLPFERNIGLGIMFGAGAAASSSTYFTSFHHTENNPKTERVILKKLLQSGQLSGLVLCPCSTHENLDILSHIWKEKIPLVFLDRAVDGIPAPLVSSDNEKGMQEIAEKLLENGHRRIAFFPYYPGMADTIRQRFSGFCHAFLAAGLPIPSEYLYVPDGKARHRAHRHDEAYIRYAIAYYESLPHMPSAVICANDMIAVGFIRLLQEAGYRVPEDISVCGFDNLQIGGKETDITTAEQDWHNFGAVAIDHIVSLMEGQDVPPVTLLKTRYIEKRSTGIPTT